jgi:hypothetical protein
MGVLLLASTVHHFDRRAQVSPLAGAADDTADGVEVLAMPTNDQVHVFGRAVHVEDQISWPPLALMLSGWLSSMIARQLYSTNLRKRSMVSIAPLHFSNEYVETSPQG